LNKIAAFRPSASASAMFTSSETIALLTGRTAGVLALRDGLYYACQAYANGMIGKAAYALILSQYGKLLTNLVGVPSIKGSDSSPTAVPSFTPPGGVVVNIAAGNRQNSPPHPKALAPPNMPLPSGSSQTPQGLDVLLTACITENDPTLSTARTNPILTPEVCRPLINGLIAAILSAKREGPVGA
jgi:hypothetical protein